MDIFIDTQTRQVWLSAQGATDAQKIKIRQTEDIRLQFLTDGSPIRQAETDTIFLGLRLSRGSGDTLASTDEFTRPGADTGYYTAALDLNTTEITTDLFDADGETRDEIEVLLEIKRTPTSGGARIYDDPTQKLILVRSVFTGTEGTPTTASPVYTFAINAEEDAVEAFKNGVSLGFLLLSTDPHP